VAAVAMRDSDCDLSSVVVVREDGPSQPADLGGGVVAVGASDSPQATLLPLAHLRSFGLQPNADFRVRGFELLPGKHGDHVGGEEAAARALAAGEVDAACMLQANFERFQSEGLLAKGAVRVLTRTPRFDHCNFTVVEGRAAERVERFRRHLLSMSHDDPEVRPLLDLEGLTAWVPARLDGYQALEAAVEQALEASP
jgi:ABC-type phosphate/phosphonate transport system substrate-binding protein